MSNIKEKETLCVNTIRALSMDAVQKANSGHPGMPMGMADVAFVLWDKILKHNPANPKWINRDRFILSAGHGSMLLYSLLHLYGYEVSLEDLKNFRQYGSNTPGHPEFGHTPGVETTTGPLGQGFATGVGMAIAEQLMGGIFNKEEIRLVDHYIYAIVSDGDLMEGISHEAASLAGHLKLNKLIYLYDSNRISIDGSTDLSFSDKTAERFKAYGWEVQQIDGHDREEIEKAILAAQKSDKPSLIECRTTIGFGSPNKQGSASSHGSPLGDDEILLTKKKLEFPSDEPFFIPEEVKEHMSGAVERGRKVEEEWNELFEKYRKSYPEEGEEFRKFFSRTLPENWDEILPAFEADETCFIPEEVKEDMSGAVERGRKVEEEWNELFEKYRKSYPEEGEEFRKFFSRTLPENWDEILPAFEADEKGIATRKASGIVLNAIADHLNNLIGGSADLTGSNNTDLEGKGIFNAQNRAGRYIHYGVREHAMGAAMNGMAQYGGIIPYGGTFLVFSDYNKPAIRVAALSKTPAIHVFTHDSIGLGEDGPTHQPIEHLSAMRATPNVTVLRPADANEVAYCWKMAIQNEEGPSLMILTRQALPTLDRSVYADASGAEKGAYILKKEEGSTPDYLLIATGSEVSIALEAAKILEEEGKSVRVVSMPSMELFSKQDLSYRQEVLPPEVKNRVSIEAASTQSWYRWVGTEGLALGINQFGMSAPYQEIYDHFGLTPTKIADKIRVYFS